jgi:hypothetical protein
VQWGLTAVSLFALIAGLWVGGQRAARAAHRRISRIVRDELEAQRLLARL